MLVSLLVFCLHAGVVDAPESLYSGNLDYLRRFSGQWSGTYHIDTFEGEPVGEFPIEKSYYWIQDRLCCAVAVGMPDGSVAYEHAVIDFTPPLLHSVVNTASSRSEFWGWVSDNKVWWASPIFGGGRHHTLYSEHLTPGPDGFTLHIAGYQWDRSAVHPHFLILRAQLSKVESESELQLLGPAK